MEYNKDKECRNEREEEETEERGNIKGEDTCL
jgi:hypothetical protein